MDTNETDWWWLLSDLDRICLALLFWKKQTKQKNKNDFSLSKAKSFTRLGTEAHFKHFSNWWPTGLRTTLQPSLGFTGNGPGREQQKGMRSKVTMGKLVFNNTTTSNHLLQAGSAELLHLFCHRMFLASVPFLSFRGGREKEGRKIWKHWVKMENGGWWKCSSGVFPFYCAEPTRQLTSPAEGQNPLNLALTRWFKKDAFSTLQLRWAVGRNKVERSSPLLPSREY